MVGTLCCARLQKLNFLFTYWNFCVKCAMTDNIKDSIWHLQLSH